MRLVRHSIRTSTAFVCRSNSLRSLAVPFCFRASFCNFSSMEEAESTFSAMDTWKALLERNAKTKTPDQAENVMEEIISVGAVPDVEMTKLALDSHLSEKIPAFNRLINTLRYYGYLESKIPTDEEYFYNYFIELAKELGDSGSVDQIKDFYKKNKKFAGLSEQIYQVYDESVYDKANHPFLNKNGKEKIVSSEQKSATERELQLESLAIKRDDKKKKEALQKIRQIRVTIGSTPGNMGIMLNRWYEAMSRVLSNMKSQVIHEPNCEFAAYKEPLLMVDPSILSIIVVEEMTSLLISNGAEERGMRIPDLATAISTAVWSFIEENYDDIMEIYTQEPLNDGGDIVWTKEKELLFGSSIIYSMLHCATLPEEMAAYKNGAPKAAFYHHYVFAKKKKIGYVKCHPSIAEVVTVEDKTILARVQTRYLPMVVPPVPWNSGDYKNNKMTGGYLEAPSEFVRSPKTGSLSQTGMDAIHSEKTQDFLDCLNILSSTAWKINHRVYDVIKEVWKNGGGIAALPNRDKEGVPELPVDFAFDVEARKKWVGETQRIKRFNQNQHSLKCDLSLKMSVATEFLHEPRFYFPHNIDFRGRAYPIPPHLNQMGSDLCRGLLLFEQGRPLGPNGLYWLKVHLANLMGKNKISFNDRVKLVDSNWNNIVASAKNPNENKWWSEADDPWQALGTCFELVDAVESGKPEEFISYMPVHMDGSCNGLQHYAALGRDVEGGSAVNLVGHEVPQDVYTQVAHIVKGLNSMRRMEGNEVAIFLEGRITRKIIKQTVMTSVYGVTYIGAREQIKSALRDAHPEVTDGKLLFNAAQHLATLVFQSLGEMFRSAQHIMKWLTDCAFLTAKASKAVTWVTPLGLPVMQPYRVAKTQSINTAMQFISFQAENDYSKSSPVNARKQSTAFPPNFVHSLDSTHMLLTAKECKARGIVFSSVHDSYWTHARDVPILSQILRDKFYKLHNMPILEELRIHFQNELPDVKIEPVPDRGRLDLHKVLTSKYFFH